MPASHGLSSRWVSGQPGQLSQRARYAAFAAAALAALLYVLAGTVGSIKPGFCLAMGGVFAVVAILLFFLGQRLVWDLVALLDLGAIAGYFAVAPTRDPHFEPWGLVIKAVQVVLLAALGYLIIRSRRAAGRVPVLPACRGHMEDVTRLSQGPTTLAAFACSSEHSLS